MSKMEFEEYGCHGTYAKKIQHNENEEYRLLVVDAPLKDDPEWRFSIEIGEIGGSANCISANLTEEEKEKIKGEIKQLLFTNK